MTATKDGHRVTTPLVKLSDGSHALVVYTSRSHAELPQEFGVLLFVSTAGGEWLPMSKAQINVIINGLEVAEPVEVHDPNDVEIAGVADLDDLISQAQGTPPARWTDLLLKCLEGRELFVRISPDRLKGGRPVITSEIGAVRGLVQAYTSRSKQELAYGAMSWAAITDMVNNAPERPAVQSPTTTMTGLYWIGQPFECILWSLTIATTFECEEDPRESPKRGA